MRTLELLSHSFGADIAVSPCGNSSNVKALFSHQKGTGDWQNTYFMVDGDNQGNSFPGERQFFHWPAYCVENFFLHPELLASANGMEVHAIQELLLTALKTQQVRLFKNNKFLAFAIEGFEGSDLTYERLASLDGSMLLPELREELLGRRCRSPRRSLRRSCAPTGIAPVSSSSWSTAIARKRCPGGGRSSRGCTSRTIWCRDARHIATLATDSRGCGVGVAGGP